MTNAWDYTGSGGQPLSMGACPTCQKQCWSTRKAAKRALRSIHTGAKKMSVYPCPTGNGYHYGHLPKPVLEGRRPRQQFTPKDNRT